MDIDLLSKMVKELILDNDKVVLPGLGSFVAEVVPSAFSDKGYTIHPPYRRLYFRSKPDEGDMLSDFYASMNNVDKQVAAKIIKDFLMDLKSVLFIKKTVVFPGLGRLRATKENNVFFVADEDLEIYPEGIGLEPVSLKTHQETDEEVEEAVAGLKEILDVATPGSALDQEPAPDPVPEPMPDSAPDPEPEPVPDSAPTPEQTPTQTPAPAPVLEPVVEPVDEPMLEPVDEPMPEPVPEPVVELVAEDETKDGAEDAETQSGKSDVTADSVVDEGHSQGSEPVEENAPKKPLWKKLLRVLLTLVIVLVVLLAVYIAAAHLWPDFIDKLLFTPEELELLGN